MWAARHMVSRIQNLPKFSTNHIVENKTWNIHKNSDFRIRNSLSETMVVLLFLILITDSLIDIQVLGLFKIVSVRSQTQFLNFLFSRANLMASKYLNRITKSVTIGKTSTFHSGLFNLTLCEMIVGIVVVYRVQGRRNNFRRLGYVLTFFWQFLFFLLFCFVIFFNQMETREIHLRNNLSQPNFHTFRRP